MTPAAGSLTACTVPLPDENPPAGDEAQRGLVAAVQQCLPAEAVLLRGPEDTFLIWLPGADAEACAAVLDQVRSAVCALPGSAPAAEWLVATRILPAACALPPILEELDAAVRGTTMAPPDPLAVREAANALERRLQAMRLYKCDGLIEDALAYLDLPTLHPATVLILGPPQSGKTRLLTGLHMLFGGQDLPLAEVICTRNDQTTSFQLLVSMLRRFFAAYPPDSLQQLFAPLLASVPWVSTLFPGAMTGEAFPYPATITYDGARTVLLTLARTAPMVAVIHGLHLADSASLNVLATLQATPGHGLRLIAGAAPDGDAVPAALRSLASSRSKIVELGPLTEDQLSAYLQEALPGIAGDEVCAALHRASDGLLLAIESTLRSCVETGALTLRDGDWQVDLTRAAERPASGLQPHERDRLGTAALTGPVPMEVLAALWDTTEEDAQATIDRGMALGYLTTIDGEPPCDVQFADTQHAAALTETLDQGLRANLHEVVATLLEAMASEDPERYAARVAYHFTQAGHTSRAHRYLQQMQRPLPQLVTPSAKPVGGLEEWDIPPALPAEAADMPRIIEAAMTIRLAGVQFRLYPPTSDMVIQAVHDAHVAVGRLLADRPSFIITYDGRSVAFDGQVPQRRDLQMTLRDFQRWMDEAGLRAIGFARGVQERDIAEFIQTLVMREREEVDDALQAKILALALPGVKVLTGTFQHDALGAGQAEPGWPAPPGGLPAGMAPGDVPAPGPTGDTRPSAPQPLADLPLGEAYNLNPTIAPLLHEAPQLDDRTLEELPAAIKTASPAIRRAAMVSLARWLRAQVAKGRQDLPEEVDTLLIGRVSEENDAQALRETATTIEERFDHLADQRDWGGMARLLASVRERLDRETSSQAREVLERVLTHTAERVAMDGLLQTEPRTPEELMAIRPLVLLVGEQALSPLVMRLKQSSDMRERARMLRLLVQFGDLPQGLLLEELHAANPWYVYRNALQILTDIGTEDALAAITDKLQHPDARVRIEAINAVARVARGNAWPHILQGLQDERPTVRARAAALVGVSPHPRMLDLLLRMLQSSRIGKEEAESVQVAAALALGHFQDDAARDVLLQILESRLFSPYRKSSADIRAAAVTALERHLGHPQVAEAIERATHDRKPEVRQTALRIWQQHLARTRTGPTA